jgi:hypothetical protein
MVFRENPAFGPFPGHWPGVHVMADCRAAPPLRNPKRRNDLRVSTIFVEHRAGAANKILPMHPSLEKLEGYQSPVSGIVIAWNTPFRAVRERLETAPVRQVEEQGLRVIRFEETLAAADGEESVDLQTELYFHPDFGYGLRSAALIIEGIGGRSHLKHEGSYRPLVRSYFRLYRILAGRYGEPALRNHVNPEQLDSLVRILDHTREQMLVTAAWRGPATQVSHDLQVSFAPRHLMRMWAAGSKLLVRNQTGKAGIVVEIVFPGGHSEATLAPDAERSFDLPRAGDAYLTARLGDRKVELKFPIDVEHSTAAIRRSWMTGGLTIDRRPW